MRKKVIWILVTIFIILPIFIGIIGSMGQGSESPLEVAKSCAPAKQADLDDIESGFASEKFTLTEGKFVLTSDALLDSLYEISPNASKENIIAARVNESDEIGIWTTSVSRGSISAINDVAKKISVWGSAASPGSRADQFRILIEESDDAKVVSACVLE
jgi:hypothetical protein